MLHDALMATLKEGTARTVVGALLAAAIDSAGKHGFNLEFTGGESFTLTPKAPAALTEPATAADVSEPAPTTKAKPSPPRVTETALKSCPTCSATSKRLYGDERVCRKCFDKKKAS